MKSLQRAALQLRRAIPGSPEPSTLITEAVGVQLQEHGYTRDELAQAVRLQADEFYRDFLGERVPDDNVVNFVSEAGDPQHLSDPG